jgi:hypothetical protein
MVGILRHFQAFSTPEQNPALGVLFTSAPPPLTPTISDIAMMKNVRQKNNSLEPLG